MKTKKDIEVMVAFNQARKNWALHFQILFDALKQGGMDEMKKKIIILTITK